MKPRKAKAQFATEIMAVLHRWTHESDLDDVELAETACFAINLWLEDEVVGFEPDEDFFPEE